MRKRTIERALRENPRWQKAAPHFRKAFIKRLKGYDEGQSLKRVQLAFDWFFSGALYCHGESYFP